MTCAYLQFSSLPESFLEVVDIFEKKGDVAALVIHRQEVCYAVWTHLQTTVTASAQVTEQTSRVWLFTILTEQADRVRHQSFISRPLDSEMHVPATYANNVSPADVAVSMRSALAVVAAVSVRFANVCTCADAHISVYMNVGMPSHRWLLRV